MKKGWIPDKQGINFSLDGPKFRALSECLTLLTGLAEDDGHETVEAWALDNFDEVESIAAEHGARVRVDGKFTNLEWRTPLDERHQVRVGLTFMTKKGKRQPSSIIFFARLFWSPE